MLHEATTLIYHSFLFSGLSQVVSSLAILLVIMKATLALMLVAVTIGCCYCTPLSEIEQVKGEIDQRPFCTEIEKHICTTS